MTADTMTFDEALVAIDSSDFRTQLSALSVLSNSKDPRAVPAFVRVLKNTRVEDDDTLFLVSYAISALGSLRATEALPHIVPFFLHGPLDDLEIEESALFTLSVLTLDDKQSLLPVLKQKLEQPDCDEEMVELVAEELRSHYGYQHEAEAATYFISQLRSKNPWVVKASAAILGELLDDRAILPLQHVAAVGPAEAREAAKEAAGELLKHAQPVGWGRWAG